MSTEYGARPVSIDLARGRSLLNPASPAAVSSPAQGGEAAIRGAGLPVTPEVVADRLSLAHWPPGHQIAVCSLAGGVGRTTMTGLLMSILAELPFAHVWKPIAGVELAPRTLGATAHRWGVGEADLIHEGHEENGEGAEGRKHGGVGTVSGAWAFTSGACIGNRLDFSAVVMDAPAGLPGELPWVAGDPVSSVLLVTRPDRASLAEAASALVWMHDHAQLARHRVVVLVNDGAGRSDQGSRAAATAVRVRCTAVHRVPYHPALGPGRTLPPGPAMAPQIRRPLTHAALDLAKVAAHLRSRTHHPTAQES